MSGQDGAGTVKLLGEDEAREGVSQGKWSKGEQKLSPGGSAARPSAGRPDGKDDVLSALIAALGEPGGESFRSHLAPTAVEKNHKSRCTS